MDPLRPASPPVYEEHTLKSHFRFKFSDNPINYQVVISQNSVAICEWPESSCVAQAVTAYVVDQVQYTHEWEGKYYLALRLAKHTGYSVFCFNRTKRTLSCIVSNITRPNFKENRLVDSELSQVYML